MNTTAGSSWGSSTCGRRGRDPAPQIRPAGIRGTIDAPIFDESMLGRVKTPDNIKPFRKSAMTTVGRTIHHYGTRNDPLIDENIRFGKLGTYNMTAQDCLRPAVVDKMGALAAAHAEKRYKSSKMEPLGKGPELTVDIPEHLYRVGFGMNTKASEDAKHLIYNCGDREAPDKYPPGAQQSRNYNWANVDPTKHYFGVSTAGNDISTKELINPTMDTDNILLPKIVKDFNSVTQPQLEKVKNLGFGLRPQGVEFTYGKAGVQDGVTVSTLLSTHGTLDDDEYERSIGKSITKSHTQRKLKAEDETNRIQMSTTGGTTDDDRTFGVPSLRTDLPRPIHRKVTNSNNYGDEVGAGGLLYPNRYIARGIDERYFTEPKDLSGIKIAANACQFGLTDAQIEMVFSKCQKGGYTSVEEFKDACYDMDV